MHTAAGHQEEDQGECMSKREDYEAGFEKILLPVTEENGVEILFVVYGM